MRSLGLGIALLGLSFLSCAQHAQLLSPVALNFFADAPRDNPWNAKIRNWQSRNQLDQAQPVAHPGKPGDLVDSYERFARETRRQIAAETVTWVQEQSRRHYIPDGETDHWATLSEVAATDGDDCDGLDLLTFTLLRKLGFAQDEIYRSIIVERDSGQHHMVTLWFEGGDKTDPWLLDPTGVVTDHLVHLSEVPTWSPIEMFDEARHFRVEESGHPGAGAVATR